VGSSYTEGGFTGYLEHGPREFEMLRQQSRHNNPRLYHKLDRSASQNSAAQFVRPRS